MSSGLQYSTAPNETTSQTHEIPFDSLSHIPGDTTKMITSLHDIPTLNEHSKRGVPVPDSMDHYHVIDQMEGQRSYCRSRDLNLDATNPVLSKDAISTVSKRLSIRLNPHTEFLVHSSTDEQKDSSMNGVEDVNDKRKIPTCSMNGVEEHLNDKRDIPTKSSFSKKGRTKSFDRRLSEAAQYAEAVGDLSTANYDRLIVVDDGDDDDDDEDENDVELLIEPTNHDLSEPHAITVAPQKSNAHRVERRPWMRRNQNSFFLHQLSDFSENSSFSRIESAKIDDNESKRVPLDPPEITTHGISRGNFAQLHRKAWLEVSDKYHRYGKNLRVYYKHWEEMGHPTNVFFDWLDSKGEAAGLSLPNLVQCPRSELDSDTVLYITNPDTQSQYKLTIVPTEDKEDSQSTFIKAKIQNCENRPVSTGSEGWIFVLRDHELYAAKKVTSVLGKSKQRFHHSSFFGGKAVQAAGILITDENGFLKYLYPHSGHYRPGEGHMQSLLYHFYKCGVDINSFQVDMQQIMHVSREKCDESTPKGGDIGDECNDAAGTEIKTKMRKTDSLYLETGFYVAAFLGHKSLMMSLGLFDQIQRIQLVPSGSSVHDIVSSAFVDNGKV